MSSCCTTKRNKDRSTSLQYLRGLPLQTKSIVGRLQERIPHLERRYWPKDICHMFLFQNQSPIVGMLREVRERIRRVKTCEDCHQIQLLRSSFPTHRIPNQFNRIDGALGNSVDADTTTTKPDNFAHFWRRRVGVVDSRRSNSHFKVGTPFQSVGFAISLEVCRTSLCRIPRHEKCRIECEVGQSKARSFSK